MREIGLFPLPLVLLPGELLPLHIFESRYKELIGECIDLAQEFGLLLADDSGLRPVGTLAAVTSVLERFDDGRMNVVVSGGERFELIELTEGRSFHTGQIEQWPDLGEEAPDEADRDRALALFRQLAELTETTIDELDLDAEPLSFALASHVDFGAEPKQRLLELRTEPERIALVIELLGQAVEAVSLARRAQEHAAGNGKVGPV